MVFNGSWLRRKCLRIEYGNTGLGGYMFIHLIKMLNFCNYGYQLNSSIFPSQVKNASLKQRPTSVLVYGACLKGGGGTGGGGGVNFT